MGGGTAAQAGNRASEVIRRSRDRRRRPSAFHVPLSNKYLAVARIVTACCFAIAAIRALCRPAARLSREDRSGAAARRGPDGGALEYDSLPLATGSSRAARPSGLRLGLHTLRTSRRDPPARRDRARRRARSSAAATSARSGGDVSRVGVDVKCSRGGSGDGGWSSRPVRNFTKRSTPRGVRSLRRALACRERKRGQIYFPDGRNIVPTGSERVGAVRLADGRDIPGFVLLAIASIQRSLSRAADWSVDYGIIVDEHWPHPYPLIWAAGDCSRPPASTRPPLRL